MKKTLRTLMAALLVLAMTLSCVSFAETTENYDGVLVSEGMMDIQYATGFNVELFKGGYRMVTDSLSNTPILVVPEGMSVPAELPENTQVLQMPVTNAYICATNITAMVDVIGGIDKVRLVGADSTWRFQSIIDQEASGYTQFAGGYTSDVDYEMIATAGTQLVVWNGYEEEVFQKLRALNVCVLCEQNTSEKNLYGRMEWMRCLGIVLGIEEQAEAYFADQVATIEGIRAEGAVGKVVAMGAMSASSGKFFSRKSGDFQADYIRYAGGDYALEDVEPDVGGSLTMTGEDFYLRFKDADVIIWSQSIGEEETMEALEKLYPAIVDFKAYQNKQIYIQADKYIQMGAAEPASVVSDIHTILTSDDPEVTTDFIIRLP